MLHSPSAHDLPSSRSTATPAHSRPESNHSGVGTSGNNTVEGGTKSSNTGTTKAKKEQKDKLQRVKLTTIASVIVVDLILAGALAGQLVSFDASLKDFLRTKVQNTFAFFDFQYNERFGFSELGLSRYQNISLTCKALLQNDSASVNELRRQFANDRIWRTNEVIALLNNTGGIVSSCGPNSAIGHHFGVGDVVGYYMRHLAATGTPLRVSGMVDQHYYHLFDAPIFDAVHDYRPDLTSWLNQEQTLARLSLLPVYCGHAVPQGFLVNVDSIFPRQYDYFGTLLFSTKSGMGGILARNTRTNVWQTAFSYNQPGSFGAQNRFPDMAMAFSPEQLDAAIASGPDAVRTGTFEYEEVPYQYALSAVPHLSLGRTVLPDEEPVDIVYAYAEPLEPVRQTVNRAMSWQIPWIVVLVLWSFLSVHFVLQRFVAPMQRLIDSVRRKKMKEFNEHLRQLKSNRTAIWALLLEVVITEGVLLILIFVNNALLDSVSVDFTSAATEGKVLSYAASSRASNLLYFLASWSSSPSFVSAAVNRTFAAASLNHVLQQQCSFLNVDAISVIGLDSEIIASSHGPSVGFAFPESGIMEYLHSQESPNKQAPFLSHSAWNLAAVNTTTPGLYRGPSMSPALTRLVVAPIRQISINNATDLVEFGDLLGAVVIVRFLNGLDSLWEIDSFTPGFFGMYLWDQYQGKFRDLTSVHKTSDRMLWGVDITDENPDLLVLGLISQYNADRVVVENDARILGQPFAASIVPFSRADEVVLAPSLVNAYLVRGLSQSGWDSVRSQLLVVQIVNMVIVVLAAAIKVALAWLPLRRFLNSLERVFVVQSISDELVAKREHAAAVMLDGGTTHPHRATPIVFPASRS